MEPMTPRARTWRAGPWLILVLIGIPVLAYAAASEFQERVLDKVGAIDGDEFIIYEPEEPEHTIVVFTDVNCPNCRNLHSGMDDYLMWGIRIKYAAFPVIGNAKEQMESVWCSDDRKAAMSQAKRGETVEAPACDNPVADHLDIAIELGFRGTPTIVTPGGGLVYGYHTPAELLDILEADAEGGH